MGQAETWNAHRPAMALAAGRAGAGTMSDPEVFAVATRLYVRLRRNAGPGVDVARLTSNRAYAREVLTLAQSLSDPEVLKLAARFEQLLFGAGGAPPVASGVRSAPRAAPAPEPEPDSEVQNAGRYVGHLR